MPAATSPLTLRIFLSSPGDVAEERRLARGVMAALERSPLLRGRVHFDIVAWDDEHAAAPMDARETPQASVNRYSGRPADCDLTLVILWCRIGTQLPPGLTRPDGSRYESGTVWEYEDALAADKPVFVYRRTAKPQIDLDDPEFDRKREQYEQVRAFFQRFSSPDGSSRGGVNDYESPAQFENLLRLHLEAFVRDQLAPEPGTPAGEAPPPGRPSIPPGVGGAAGGHAPAAPAANWWATLPGILTALAALVSAVATLFGVFYRPDKPAPQPAGAPSAAVVAPAAPGPGAAASAPVAMAPALPKVFLAAPDEVWFGKVQPATYTVLAIETRARTPAAYELRLRIRMLNRDRYENNFWDRGFRLLVDDIPLAPDSNLNLVVAGNSAKEGELSFEVPFTARHLALLILHHEAEGEVGRLPLRIGGERATPGQSATAAGGGNAVNVSGSGNQVSVGR